MATTSKYHKRGKPSTKPTVQKFAEGGSVGPDDGYETMRQVNAGPKTNKGGDGVDPYPKTDDNTFLANGADGRMIRAKRQLRDGLKGKE